MAEHHAPGAKPKGIMETLEYYLVTKAPYQIPANGREWIVKYGPWINVVLLVILAPAILLVLGIGAIALPFSALGGVHAAAGLSLALLALIAQVVLMIAALPGLFARKKSGWNIEFYSLILNFVYSILSFNILGAIVNAVIGGYILFQVRHYYK